MFRNVEYNLHQIFTVCPVKSYGNYRIFKLLNSHYSMHFDLEERTRKFSVDIIAFAKHIPNVPVYYRLIPQLVASATSIGANYREATEGESKKDFRHKVSICNKEAKETTYWLSVLLASEEALHDDGKRLLDEANQLHRIFSKIVRSCWNT